MQRHAHPFRQRLELASLAVGAFAPGPATTTLAILHECKKIAALGCTVERIRQCCEIVRDHRVQLQFAITNDTDSLEVLQISLLLRECVFGVNTQN